MKNPIVQFSIVVIAFVALAFVMGYTKPMAEEQPKHYIVVRGMAADFEGQVDQKLSEGWRPQGGVTLYGHEHLQAMVK